MKKKQSWWHSFLDFVVDTGKETLVDTVQEKMQETLEVAELKLERALKRVLSVTALFLLLFIGFIFALVGLSQYLSERVEAFNYGVGFIVVGAGLVVLALLLRIAANR